MMEHDEGRLRAWLDGELPAPEAAALERRVAEDPALRRRMNDLRVRDQRARHLLEELDEVPPPTARVRAAVRDARGTPSAAGAADGDRLVPEGTEDGAKHGWARRTRLAQAAVLVLVFAGAAAAAIPGSPIREWIARTLDSGPTESEAPAPADAVGSRAVQHETGLVMTADDGRIRIELVGLPSGTEILVQLTDGDGAGVFGSEASSLELEGERGRIRARATGGPIRVELPRAIPSADLVVDGRVYLVKEGENVTLRVPSADSSATGIRLRAGS